MANEYTTDQIRVYQNAVGLGNSYHDSARIALGQTIRKTPSHLERDRADDFLKWLDEKTFSSEAQQTIKELAVADQPDHDPVNHPRHYTQYKGLEIIDLTEQMNFNLGNAVKYIARAGFKDPAKQLEDLEKAIWYTRREIERLTNAE